MGDDAKAIQGAVHELAEPVAESVGVELVEVEVKGQKGRRVLRLVIDGDEGVDVDQIAAVSRGVSELLDKDDDVILGAYTLEVTSPGVDRPLTEPRHFARNVGRYVKVEHEADGAPTETEGKLAEADEHEVVLNVKGRMVKIPLDTVERAKVVLPW